MTRLSQRPLFELDVDSDEDHDMAEADSSVTSDHVKPTISIEPTKTQESDRLAQVTTTTTSADITTTALSYFQSEGQILRFCSESLYSFSYAYDCNNAMEYRLSILRKSLRMVRDNPAMMKELQDTVGLPRVASDMDLDFAFATHGGHSSTVTTPNSQLGSLRPSASSATLSFLGKSSESSQVAENVNSLLNVLDEVGLPESSGSSYGYAYPVLSGSLGGSHVNLLDGKDELDQSDKSMIQSHLLDALSVPYIDITPAMSAQRILPTNLGSGGGSTTNHDYLPYNVSSLNLTPLSLPSGVVKGTAFNVSPLHPISSKYSSAHAIFTTAISAPFDVLSLNDMACLIFGKFQHELRHKSILTLFPSSIRPHISDMLSGENNFLSDDKTEVVFCGHVFPILKSNGSYSRVSIWTKRKCSTCIITWVMQEVACDKALLNINLDGTVESCSGRNSLARAIDQNLQQSRNVRNILPDLPHDYSPGDENVVGTYKSYSIVSSENSDNVAIPCFMSVVDTKPHSTTVEIASCRHIAGAIIIDQRDLKIIDYNKCIMFSLFGYDLSSSIRGNSITSIIPKFTQYLTRIKRLSNFETLSLSAGLVIPEQMFRKISKLSSDDNVSDPCNLPLSVFRSPSVEAVNKYGRLINVDVQMRIVSSSYYALWISYSSLSDGSNDDDSFEMPSQLNLLHFKRKRRNISQERKRTTSSGGSTISPTDSDENLRTHLSRDSSVATSIPTSETPEDSSSREPATPGGSEKSTSSLTEDLTSNSSGVETPVVGAQRRVKKLSEFSILQTLGEGAYGKVILAQRKSGSKEVVIIKCVIKNRILVDTWIRDRKLGTIPNEIKVMVTLNDMPHKNIIRLLDFFEDDVYFHIEMERHGNPGTDLFDLIELKPNMPEMECKSIFRQVVSAVLHLHMLGIVHRDIKDENIIVDSTGWIKLIDYGSAAFVRQGPFDIFVGTMDYAAPEVLEGKPFEGKPQDVWALGILLYTIIYKENPFYNVDEIMEGELRIPYITSQGCINLIKKILVRDIRSRPSIQDIANDEWLSS